MISDMPHCAWCEQHRSIIYRTRYLPNECDYCRAYYAGFESGRGFIK